jgi:DNA replicative helicase MCM subunit Mcm2 (Cdc46/Mcm family)
MADDPSASFEDEPLTAALGELSAQRIADALARMAGDMAATHADIVNSITLLVSSLKTVDRHLTGTRLTPERLAFELEDLRRLRASTRHLEETIRAHPAQPADAEKARWQAEVGEAMRMLQKTIAQMMERLSAAMRSETEPRP